MATLSRINWSVQTFAVISDDTDETKLGPPPPQDAPLKGVTRGLRNRDNYTLRMLLTGGASIDPRLA